jgi:hypothetical protein
LGGDHVDTPFGKKRTKVILGSQPNRVVEGEGGFDEVHPQKTDCAQVAHPGESAKRIDVT